MPQDPMDTNVAPGAGAEPSVSQIPDVAEPTTPGSTSTPAGTPAEEMVLGKPKSYWEGLETEHERVKASQSTLQKRLDRLTRQRNPEAFLDPSKFGNEEEVKQWANHPATQQVLAKAADQELKEGVEELMGDYPNVPEAIKTAIRKNPYGFVPQGTVYVDDALFALEQFLLEQSSSSSPSGASAPAAPTPTGSQSPAKEFPIAGTNAPGTGTSGKPTVDKLVELLSGDKKAKNEAFRMLSDKEVSGKDFDEAMLVLEKSAGARR